MKKCLYRYCENDISHKASSALFCDQVCNQKQIKLPNWEQEYINSNAMGIRTRRMFLREPEKPISDNEKWIKIGLSSSYEAMRSVYRMFN